MCYVLLWFLFKVKYLYCLLFFLYFIRQIEPYCLFWPILLLITRFHVFLILNWFRIIKIWKRKSKHRVSRFFTSTFRAVALGLARIAKPSGKLELLRWRLSAVMVFNTWSAIMLCTEWSVGAWVKYWLIERWLAHVTFFRLLRRIEHGSGCQ